MALNLFEFLEQFIIDILLIKNTQFEKTGSKCTAFIPLEIKKINSTLKLEIVHVFSRHFHVRIWRVLFTSLSTDEFQLTQNEHIYLSASIFYDFFL